MRVVGVLSLTGQVEPRNGLVKYRVDVDATGKRLQLLLVDVAVLRFIFPFPYTF